MNIKQREESFGKKITFFTFILTFFVVLSHWQEYYSIVSHGEGALAVSFITKFYSLMGSVALVSFFMISGFLFFSGVESFSDLKGKILRRVISLGIPFVVWNVFNLAFNIAYGLYKGQLDIGALDLIKGFTISPFNAPTWYLLALLVLACLSPLMIMLKKRPRVALIMAIVVFLGVPFLYSAWQPANAILVWIKRLVGYFPVYFATSVIAMHKRDSVIKDDEYKHSRVISYGSLILSLAIILIFTFGSIEMPVVRLFTYQILPALLWLAMPSSKFDKLTIKLPITIAPFIYGMHIVLKLILNSLWTQKLFKNVDFPLLLDIIFHFILVGVIYGICLGVAYLAKKLLPEKIYKIFAGGSAGRKMF